MKELSMNEVQEVNGGISKEATWGVSIGTAAAFLGMGLAVANPIGAGILVGASILSSANAIYAAW